MPSTAVQDITRSLEALLALLRRHTDGPLPGPELTRMSQRFHELCTQHDSPLEGINAEQRQVLVRGICELGPLLSRLDRQFQRNVQRAGGVAHQLQLTGAVSVASCATLLGTHLHLSGSEWQQLGAAVVLLLGSGTAMLEQMPVASSSSLPLLAAHMTTVNHLFVGTVATDVCLAEALPAFVPASTVRWLGAISAAVCHQLPRLDSGGVHYLLRTFSGMACTFLVNTGPQRCWAAFPAVQAAAGSSPEVQHQLARAISHCLQGSSAQVLQHAGSDSAGSAAVDGKEAWQTCTFALQLAASPVLLPVMRQQVQQTQGQAAFWPLAFRLAERLPAQPPPGVPTQQHAALWAHLLRFVGRVPMAPAATDAEQGLQAGLRMRLARLFPRAAAAVQTLSTAPDVGTEQADLFVGAAALAFSVGRAVPTAQDHLGALQTAADAALRLLPLAVQHTSLATGGASGPGSSATADAPSPGTSAAEEPYVAGAAKDLLRCLCDLLTLHVDACCSFMDGLLQHQLGTPAPRQAGSASLAQLLPNALQLHSSTCRLVHWMVQLPASQRGLVLEGAQHWPGVVSLLFGTLVHVSDCARAAADPEEPSLRRQRLASRAAHVEACLLVQDRAGLGAGCSSASASAEFAASLLACLQDPLALTTDAQLLAELRTTAMLLPDTAESKPFALDLIAEAGRSPILCSLLLQDGTLQRLLAAHAAAGAASELLAQQLRSAAGAFESDIESSLMISSVEWLTAAQPGSAHPAITLAQLLLQHWQSPEQQAPARLELARAATTRPCAYLRCANLGAEAGPEPGRQPGSQRCGGCKAVRYCGTTCSHADWRGPLGHRRVCAALAAERVAGLNEGQPEDT